MDNASINLKHEDTIVNLCDKYGVDNTQREEYVMILDPGAPVSLAGRPWFSKYITEFDLKIEDMKSSDWKFDLEVLIGSMSVDCS